MTGSQWILSSLAAMKEHGTPGERLSALTAATVERQKEGKPIAKWELARLEEAGGWKQHYVKVEQFMTTDLFTVHEDEPIDLVASLMDWERIRHVPVEDHDSRLVGLISYRALIHLLAQGRAETGGQPVPVGDIMKKDPVTVSPETSSLEALELMRSHRIGSLPVVKDGRLVGNCHRAGLHGYRGRASRREAQGVGRHSERESAAAARTPAATLPCSES